MRSERISYQPSLNKTKTLHRDKNDPDRLNRDITPKMVKMAPRTSEYSLGNKMSLKNSLMDTTSPVDLKVQRSVYVPRNPSGTQFMKKSD